MGDWERYLTLGHKIMAPVQSSLSKTLENVTTSIRDVPLWLKVC